MHKLSVPKPGLPDRLPSFVTMPGWLLALYTLPPITGLLAKLSHSKNWFGDYQAVACAGLKWIGHQPLYTLNLQCDGMHASSYVYIPMVAQGAAYLEQILGEPGFFWLYLTAFLMALSALIYVPFFSRLSPGSWREKMPFFVFLSGSAFMWGNIAVILHGLILTCALFIETAPWLLIGAIILAAWVKPVFLTALIIVLIASMRWPQKLLLISVGICAGLAPTLIFSRAGGDLAKAWFTLLSHYVYDVTPGYGFFGWMDMIGINANSLFAKLGYLLFAGGLGLSALSLAYGLKLNNSERLWLALTLAALLIPRIMSQDVFLLAPGLVVIANKSRQHGPLVIKGLCGLALFGSLTNIGDLTTPLALLGLSLYLLWAGWKTACQAGYIPVVRPLARNRMVTDSKA